METQTMMSLFSMQQNLFFQHKPTCVISLIYEWETVALRIRIEKIRMGDLSTLIFPESYLFADIDNADVFDHFIITLSYMYGWFMSDC